MAAGMDLVSGARLGASDPESYTAEAAECAEELGAREARIGIV